MTSRDAPPDRNDDPHGQDTLDDIKLFAGHIGCLWEAAEDKRWHNRRREQSPEEHAKPNGGAKDDTLLEGKDTGR